MTNLFIFSILFLKYTKYLSQHVFSLHLLGVNLPSIQILSESKMGFQRLSEFIKPTLYNVHLWPNIETFKFKGNVVIDVDVSKDG